MGEHTEGKNNRKSAREKLLRYLKVYDRDSNEFLGHLIDISKSGMQIVTEKTIPLNREFRLGVQIVQEEFLLRAESVWLQEDSSIYSYNAGFRFIGLSEQSEKSIHILTQALKLMSPAS